MLFYHNKKRIHLFLDQNSMVFRERSTEAWLALISLILKSLFIPINNRLELAPFYLIVLTLGRQ